MDVSYRVGQAYDYRPLSRQSSLSLKIGEPPSKSGSLPKVCPVCGSITSVIVVLQLQFWRLLQYVSRLNSLKDDHQIRCLLVNASSGSKKASTTNDVPIDAESTALILMLSAMVMLLTPGINFLHAGFAGDEMASNAMLMSFMSMTMTSYHSFALRYTLIF